jgi:hypothetical protein
MFIEAPPDPMYYDARDFHADILDIALVKNVLQYFLELREKITQLHDPGV